MSAALSIDHQTITSKELVPLLEKYRLLPNLAREVVIDQAIADKEITSEELNLACQQIFEQYQLKTDSQLNAWLQQQSMTLEQLEQQLERKLKLNKFKQATWGNQLEAYFFKRARQLDQAVYSLIRVQDAEIANELYFRVQEAESSFTEVAQQYSQGSEAQTGGFIGPVTLSTLHPQIAQMLYCSQSGQLWQPTFVEGWWVIIRLEKLIRAQLDESMQQRLLEENFQLWLQEQIQQKVAFVLFPDSPLTASSSSKTIN